jgi:hypothetical protein
MRGRLLDLIEDLENAIAFLLKQGVSSFALRFSADDSDENGGGMKVTGDRNVVDGDEADLVERQFPSNHFADLTLQKLADTFQSKRRHGGSFRLEFALTGPYNFCGTFSSV